MNREISSLRNLGPKTAKLLAEVDIFNENELRAAGAAEAYRRLKFFFGREVTIIALYAMEAALADCDWRNLSAETKRRLRESAGAN